MAFWVYVVVVRRVGDWVSNLPKCRIVGLSHSPNLSQACTLLVLVASFAHINYKRYSQATKLQLAFAKACISF